MSMKRLSFGGAVPDAVTVGGVARGRLHVPSPTVTQLGAETHYRRPLLRSSVTCSITGGAAFKHPRRRSRHIHR